MAVLSKKDVRWISKRADELEAIWKKSGYIPPIVKTTHWTREKNRDYWFRYAAIERSMASLYRAKERQ